VEIGIVAGQSGHTAPFARRLVARGATLTVLPVQPGDEAVLLPYGVQHSICSTAADLVGRCDAVLVLEDRGSGSGHEELAGPYLRAGTPVFIDKPLMADLDSAKRVMAAAAASGIPVMSSSSARYAEPVRGLRSIALDTGLATLTVTGPGDLWFYGVHLAEIAVAVLGPGFESVSSCRDERGVTARLRHRSGTAVTFALESAVGVAEGFSVTARSEGVFGSWPLTSYGPWYDLLIDDVVTMAHTRTAPINPAETIEVMKILDAIERSADGSLTTTAVGN
jgi:hypothetical protein